MAKSRVKSVPHASGAGTIPVWLSQPRWWKLGVTLGLWGLLLPSSLLTTICADPNVVAWGANDFGQIDVPPDLTNAVMVAGGWAHSVALRADGTVVAWGAGLTNSGKGADFGQAMIPAGLSDVVAVAASDFYSLALRSDGTVVAWGNSGRGEPQFPRALDNVVAFAAGGGRNLTLRNDGTLISCGRTIFPVSFPELPSLASGSLNVVDVAINDSDFSLVLRAEGFVLGWGRDWLAPGIGDIPPALNNAVAIAAGRYHNLALTADGQVISWGWIDDWQPPFPPSLSNVVAIAAGNYHYLALTDSGSVTAWGWSNHGQTNVPAGLADVAAIAGGGEHSLAVIGSGAPVLISPGLADRSIFVGGTVYWRAAASGARPLYYQWLFNGKDLPGATNSVLALANANAGQAGTYSVRVSNSLGVSTGRMARLSVEPALLFSQSRRQDVDQGSSVTLTVEARATAPLSYQWHHNGVDLPAATNSSLTLAGAQLSQAGAYSVSASNIWGVVTSADARIGVTRPFAPDPLVQSMVEKVHDFELLSTMNQLTGEEPVVVAGAPVRITTRHTLSGISLANAEELAFKQLEALGLQVHFQDWQLATMTGRNVVAIQPGVTRPDEFVVVSAHLDDEPETGPAPGAEDNASGSAAVLLCARIFSGYRFERTLQFVLFSGEEQGLLGSTEFAGNALVQGDDIVAALVPDLIASRADSPPYLSLRVRRDNPADSRIVQVFTNVINHYGERSRLGDAEIRYETGQASSDHESFWGAGYPAVWILDSGRAPIHSREDTVSGLDLEFFSSVVRAIVGTASHIAVPLGLQPLDLIEVANSDWTPGSGVGASLFHAKLVSGAKVDGVDPLDVAWSEEPTTSSAGFLRIYSDPYQTKLQTDARPTEGETIFRTKLAVTEKTGVGLLASNRLRFSFLAPPDEARIYLARIHVNGRYVAGATEFDWIGDLRDVVSAGGFVDMPALLGVPDGSVYGTCDMAVRFLQADAAACRLRLIDVSERSVALVATAQLGARVVDDLEASTGLGNDANWKLVQSYTNYFSPDAAHFESGWTEVRRDFDRAQLPAGKEHFFRLRRRWTAAHW